MMAADYRHIGGRENRLGRHYSRFSALWPAPALAGQSLALPKLCDAGPNRRSRANLCAAEAQTNPAARWDPSQLTAQPIQRGAANVVRPSPRYDYQYHYGGSPRHPRWEPVTSEYPRAIRSPRLA